MKLEFIPLDNLRVSKANMRHARKAPDVSDILPTIRARGVLQPLIVRPCRDGGEASPGFEIVAGARRFHAAQIVAGERRIEAGGALGAQSGGDASGETGEEAAIAAAATAVANDPQSSAEACDPVADAAQLPCAILDEGDDASAIEASLIENIARLDPDEVSRWECFTRLIREGRRPEDIAATFGLPDLAVRRVLALGNLLPRIRDLYRREQIDAATVRHLTLASKSQQKAWLALAEDPDAYAPRGYQLKGWLFGGQSVPVRHALFDVAASGLATIADLFGEDSYFADTQAFWAAQNEAVEARRTDTLEAGWADAIVVGPDTHFHEWEYEKTAKRKGGRVYIDVRGNGEVIVHEGYVDRREAARLHRAAERGGDGGSSKIARPELTSVTQVYVDLHRHATVRAALLDHPGTALRLMVAHAICGSHLWRVGVEPQAARSDALRESLDESRAEAVFDKRRRACLAIAGFGEEEPTMTGGGSSGLCGAFARLLALCDGEVLDILAVVMGETLAAGSAAVEAVGTQIGVDPADWWEADEAFLDTLRDREVLLAMVGEVAGPLVATANAGEKTKTLKAIIRDHLAGAGGRAKREGWVPRWMAFPPTAYTARGGVGTVAAHARALAERSAAFEEPPVETAGGDAGPLPVAAGGNAPQDGDDRLAA
ncbi:ParB-like protein [Novosphingobium resinovorum]|uniref:ParB-like protein n=1 Tax=Novosphingobium resinovorum TaxID=158500 RepID=A0A031JSM1_9SPHN|nr:ParB N-terminal domain-containing protein [Novosphingobium resinovorum]EZP79352.1 ParB-like protein [Novosphingobium resinovorum]